ncbi:MAG TPA: DMT family transporter [Candidatus Dormibacteraeota bacterium]|nr:DMT family transporter [Candidatus Dormibacteraeota bacterium]
MTRRGLLLFVAMSLIWGIPYLLIRIAVSGVTPATLVFGRTTIAALILMPLVLARGDWRRIGRRWIPLVAFAGFEVAIPWFLLSSAEQRLSSSLAGLLISAVPLVGTLIAPLFGNRDSMGPSALVGLLVGLAGVGAIVGFDLHASDAGALVEMVGVVVGYAVGPAILSRFLAGIRAVTVNGIALTLCALAYAPLAFVQRPESIPSPAVLGSVVVLAVVCTALAFILFFALIAEVGPVRATVITYINPAVAALLGVVVLREGFTLGMGAGFVLVIVGSVLATRRRAPSRAPEPLSGAASEPGGQSSV